MTAILATKLFEPRVPRNLVARPRLVERLRDALDARVTLVSAPAGYGKSTLISEWRASPAGRDVRVAWLSLDDADNDPGRFWSHLGASLDRASPGLGEPLLESGHGPTPVAVRPLLEQLSNALATLEERLVVVLDDLHAVTNPEIIESIGFLIDHLPPLVHLIVATRVDPQLPVASWRARRHVVELRVPDLRFTTDELGSYLERHGVALDDESVALLDARTEGWAAGMHLAALTLAGVDDRAGFVQTFAGDHRAVVDYLAEEVLARQRDDVLEFLLDTCVLDRMCGPLCDALTGRDDGQAMLEALEAANLFIVPLDGTRTWYRYHHLFAELLRRELGARRPASEPALHARAARWLARAGSAAEAVPHAVAAADWDLVIELGTDHGLEFVVRGEIGVLRQLYGTAADELRSRPESALGFAWLAMLSADLAGARRWLDEARTVIAATPDIPPGPTLDAEILGAVLADRDGDRTAARAGVERVLRDLDEHAEVSGIERAARRGRVLLLRARDALLDDDASAAADVLGDVFADVVVAHRAQRPARLAIEVLGIRALLAVWDGRTRDGLRDAAEALDVERDHALAGTPHGIWARLAIGTDHLERLELEDAEQELAAALQLARLHGDTQCVALVGAVWSDWLRLSGLPAEATEAVQLIRQELRHVRELAVVAVQRLGRADALARLALGDARGAATAWDDAGGRAGTTSARIALAHDDAERAVREADAVVAAAAPACRRHERIEALGVAALAHATLGDHVTAAARLASAVRTAARTDWVAPLVELGPAVRPLLSRLAPDDDAAAMRFRARLLAAFAGRRPGAVGGEGLVERLSERELAVLRRLPTPLSNQEIAALLFVSLNTVKTQLQSIYRKLGVRSRHEAIERARELDLL